MAKTDANVLVLGPCDITVGGVDMGYVQDAVFTPSYSKIEAMVAEYGDTPIKSWELAVGGTLTFTKHECTITTYQKLIGGTSVITDGTDSALGFGKLAGTPITPVEVTVTPQSQMALSGEIGTLTLWKCVPDGPGAISYNAETQKLEVTLKCQVDSSKNSGEKIGRFGDPNVAADTSAPTVSTYLPLDDATGVAVDATVNATFNEALDPGTINNGSVLLMLGADSSGPQTPVAGVVSYDVATSKITFTPSANLSASTLYELIITTAVKNVSGVAFAGAKSSFTTA
jgi:hypothetical protein